LAEFSVVFANFAYQLLDHRLAARVIQAASQFSYGFGHGGDDLVGIDGIGLVGRYRIFGKETVDGFDDQAVQARPFFVLILFVGDGRNSD
jgi:hypothetical protein